MNEGILGGYDPLIGPTGRAFMAGERQGMTPEQMAQSGAISFADAIALKQMADRARMSAQAMQAMQAPQPQPTVVDDLKMQVAGAAAAPYRDSGIAALPAQNIGTQAMASGGIVAFSGGGTPDEAEEYPSASDYLRSLKLQARARGDLAAMAQIDAAIKANLAAGRARRRQQVIEPIRQFYGTGIKDIQEATRGTPAAISALAPQPASGVSRPPPPTNLMVDAEPPPAPAVPPAPMMSQAELDQMFRTDPYVTGGGGGAGLASLARGTYKPSTDALAAQLKDVQGRKYDTAADYAKAGIGVTSRAQEAKINKELEKMPEDKRFAALMALSEAGFRMAGAASKPGATFLGAAAEGGTEGLKSYAAGRKELREREERLGDKASALAQAREDLTRAAMDRDAALRRGDQEQAQQISIKMAELESKMRETELQMRDSAANRSAMLARDQDPTRRMQALYYKLKLAGEDEKAARVLEAMTASDRRLLQEQMRAASAEEIARLRLQGNNPFGGFGGGNYAGFKLVEVQ